MANTVVKLENEKWSILFDEGVGYIIYNWVVKKKKSEIGLFFEEYLQSKFMEKNPRINDFSKTLIKVYQDFLNELSTLPNEILYYDDGSIEEMKYCEVIKKHIKLGNIKVDDTEYELDLFDLSNSIDMYGNLIIEDVVYDDLTKWYLQNIPNWKEDLFSYVEDDKIMAQQDADIKARQNKVHAILAAHNTDIFGSDL